MKDGQKCEKGVLNKGNKQQGKIDKRWREIKEGKKGANKRKMASKHLHFFKYSAMKSKSKSICSLEGFLRELRKEQSAEIRGKGNKEIKESWTEENGAGRKNGWKERTRERGKQRGQK